MRVHRAGLVLLLPLLAACGQRTVATPPHDDATPVPAAVTHPKGAGQVVLRIESSPGMSSADSAFSQPPGLVVTGDGTTYVVSRTGSPGGIVAPMLRFTASEADLQLVLSRAREDGLLAPPSDYATPETVYDAGDTTVTLTLDGHTWQHQAQALGGVESDTAVRNRLDDFVHFAAAWAHQIRSPRPERYRPDALKVMAQSYPAQPGSGLGLGTWPSDGSVRLSEVGRCSVVGDPALIRLLDTSSDHYYRDGGSTYLVAAVELLPGESCSD